MIGVIGGGLAGLTATHELQSRGHEVVVFESDAHVGDFPPVRSASDTVAPRYLHPGSSAGEASHELARSLDVEIDARVARTEYYLDGVVHPVGRRRELLAFPPLSLRDTSYFRSLVHGGGVPPCTIPEDALADPESLADVSARSFVAEHATTSLYDHAIEPILRARFGDVSGRISASWLVNRVARQRGGSTGTVVSRRSLVDALVQSIGPERIHTESRVTAVGTRRGALDHLVAVEEGKRQEYDVDTVVFDTPPRRFARLIGYRWTGKDSPTTAVRFGLDDSLLTIDRLIVVDDAPFGRLFALPAPQEHEDIEQVLYAIAADEPADGDVETRFRRGVESLFPDFDGERVQWSAVHTETTPVPDVGYTQHVISRDGSTPSGWFYAGTASRERYADRSVDGAVRAGRATAEAVTR